MYRSGIVFLSALCLILLSAATSIQQPADGSAARPVYAAYFYDKGCQPCSGAEYNVEYLHERFPQLSVQQFNASQDEALGKWLTRRAGRSGFRTPALFIGDQAWIGEVELIPSSIQPTVERYSMSGIEKTWDEAAPIRWRAGLSSYVPGLDGVIAISFGLVDGLIPSAISALLFLEAVIIIVYGRPRDSTNPGLMSISSILKPIVAFSVSTFVVLSVLGLVGYDHPIGLESWLSALRQPALVITILCALALALVAVVKWTRIRRTQHLGIVHEPPASLTILIACVAGIPVAILSLASAGSAYVPAMIYIYSIFTSPTQAFIAVLLYSALWVLPLAVILVLALQWFWVSDRS
jgi:hypothetical protein